MKNLFFLVVLVSLSINSHADTPQDCNEQRELIAKLQNQLSNLEHAKANLRTLWRDESELKSQLEQCSDQIQCNELKRKVAYFPKQAAAIKAQIESIEYRMHKTIKELE